MKILLRLLIIAAVYIVPPIFVFGLIVLIGWGLPDMNGSGMKIYRVLTAFYWTACLIATINISLDTTE